jgi:hypothetical protein
MSYETISNTHSGHCTTVDTDHKPATADDELTPEMRDALKAVAHTVHRLNAALRHAVEAGATIELRRRARVHSGDGCWADQMSPLVLPKKAN